MSDNGKSNKKRRKDFLRYLPKSKSIREAAIKAGYSETYANTSLYSELRKDDKFHEQVLKTAERYAESTKALFQLQLPALFNAYMKAIEKYQEDPELLINKPKTAETVLKISKLLQEQPIQSPVINIGELKLLMSERLSISSDRPKRIEECINVEYEEIQEDKGKK